MGNNFPQIKNLKEMPSCISKTLQLIERSFKYSPTNSFSVDFAPLMVKTNHQNCFILIDENENVLAHVGAREMIMRIGSDSFSFTMLGGIAVEENSRGQGHFQTLFQDVLAEKRSDTHFFLLWSDQEKLYNKYGFYLCGSQYELDHHPGHGSFRKTTFSELRLDQKDAIQGLYKNSFSRTYLTPERTSQDWETISLITSSELFIKEDHDKIDAYFFRGKGQDLTKTIHEYGHTQTISDFITEARAYGKVWIGSPLVGAESAQFQFMMAPGDTAKFRDFLKAYTNQQVSLRDINPMKQEAYFDFEGETLALELEEFLRGVFGPGSFEEFGELRPIYISGLDSI